MIAEDKIAAHLSRQQEERELAYRAAVDEEQSKRRAEIQATVDERFDFLIAELQKGPGSIELLRLSTLDMNASDDTRDMAKRHSEQANHLDQIHDVPQLKHQRDLLSANITELIADCTDMGLEVSLSSYNDAVCLMISFPQP